MNRNYSFAKSEGTACCPLLRIVHAATLTGVVLGGASCGGGQSFDDGSDELGTNAEAPTEVVVDAGSRDGTPSEVSVEALATVVVDAGNPGVTPNEASVEEPTEVVVDAGSTQGTPSEVSVEEPTEVVVDAGSTQGRPSEVSVEAPSDVSAAPEEGRSFLLTVPANSWVEPRGIGKDIGPYVPTFAIAWTDTAVWLATADENGMQEPCAPAIEFVGADPFAVGPIDLPTYLRNGDVEVAATLYDFTLTDVLSPLGPAEDGTLQVVLDAREIAPLFTLLVERTGDALCAAARDGLGVDCQPCASDGQLYCLAATAESLGAAEQPSALALTPERMGEACSEVSAP